MTRCTVTRPVPLSMGFSRREDWSRLPCPPPGDLPNPGIEPACGFFTTSTTWEARELRGHFNSICYMTGQGKARPRALDETWWGRTYKLPKACKGMQDLNTQTHGQVLAALLTDSQQACSPFGGLSRPSCPSLPLAWSLLLALC